MLDLKARRHEEEAWSSKPAPARVNGKRQRIRIPESQCSAFLVGELQANERLSQRWMNGAPEADTQDGAWISHTHASVPTCS